MGFVYCSRNHRHWGEYGAAGILVVRTNDGVPTDVLLQLRSPSTHNSSTWSVPGGAKDKGETAQQAALREAWEEITLLETDIEIIDRINVSHGSWSYTTFIAQFLYDLNRPVEQLFSIQEESVGLEWVPIYKVGDYELHPDFEIAWNSALKDRVLRHTYRKELL